MIPARMPSPLRPRIAAILLDPEALWNRRACDAVAAALIAAALVVAVRATHGLPVPYDPDHFRDLAFAQTARDGHPLADAYYRGEWIWYNPLLTWIVAAISSVSGATIVSTHVNGGPVLNLLGPLSLYVLAARTAGRPAAVTALAAYLFFLCREDCWACATYSPWLFTSTFAQGLFFSSVLAIGWAAKRRTEASAAIAGAAVGITFLAHTAPALILAAICATTLGGRRLLVAAVTGVIVSAPFLAAIVGRYHLHVVNRAPLEFLIAPLTWGGLPHTLRTYAPWGVAALAGFFWLRSRLLVTWVLAAATFFVLTLVWTSVVPIFHFWIYLLAAVAILAGQTLARLTRAPIVTVAVVLVAVAWHWPTYAQRQDFTLTRQIALDRDPNQQKAAAALRDLTRVDDVVLGTYGAVNLIIGPAGRKTVAPHPFMASPYLPVAERAAERDAMLKAIQTGDVAAFGGLAEKYGVTAVVSVGQAECQAASVFPMLEPRERFGSVCLALVRR
jgi:MFS family permease